MLARIRSAAILGIDAYPVDVEVDITSGLPSFATVGLPNGAVREGRERIGAALTNAGFEFPLRRITVNLAPADIRKFGSGLDLPIALGVLVASGQLPDVDGSWSSAKSASRVTSVQSAERSRSLLPPVRRAAPDSSCPTTTYPRRRSWRASKSEGPAP
jgi:Subunit ChlI of Mg-chelatase